MIETAVGRASAGRTRDWPDGIRRVDSDIIDLSGDGLSEETSDSVRASTISKLQDHLADHYTRRPGVAALCEAVAEWLADRNVAVDPSSEVVISNGAREARFVALRELAKESAVLLPSPWMRDHYDAARRLAKAEVRTFDPASDSEPEAAEGDVLLLPNPNPATGQLYDTEALDRVAGWAREFNLTVVADETLAPWLKAQFSHNPFAALPGMKDRTLTLGSFGRVSGLSAWKVAWFAGPKELVTRVRDLKQAMTICSSAPSQYAALAGFADAGSDLDQRIERVKAVEALLDRLGIPYLRPHTVAFVVADVSALGGSDMVTAACLRNGVRVLGGSHFGSPGKVRITASNLRFKEGVDRLEQAFEALKEEKEGSDEG